MDNVAALFLDAGDQAQGGLCCIIQPQIVDQRPVRSEQVSETSRISPADVAFGNSVTALPNAVCNPRDAEIGNGQPQKEQDDSIALFSQFPKPIGMAAPGERRLKTKALPRCCEFVDAFQKEPSRSHVL